MALKKSSLSKKTADTKTTVKAVTNKKTINVIPGAVDIYNTLKSMPIVGVIIAEFIGTFMLVAYMFTVQMTPLYVAFAVIGVVLMASRMTSVHLNPAMTIGAFVMRKINAIYALGRILAQILGAIVAYLVLNAFLQQSDSAASSTTSLVFHAAQITEKKEWLLFFAELLGTTILAFGFAAALKANKDKLSAGVAYGFATLIALIVVGTITATYLAEQNTGLTFLNPAAAIAANGLSWNIWPISVFVIAPILGSVVGIAVYDFMQSQSAE